jgi:uncharacterized membrane protein YeaQ/YmgE (transglycosylase-associated protein family)
MQLEGIAATDILIWTLFGLIVALVVHLVDRGGVKGGIIATIAAGIVGALLGGLLSASIIYRAASGFNLQHLALALTGALILALILRLTLRDKQHIKTIRMKIG